MLPFVIVGAPLAILVLIAAFVWLVVDDWGQAKQPRYHVEPPIPGVQCPSCHHHQARKITAGNKVAAGAGFGIIASGYVAKTFKCGNCSYTW